MNLCFETIAQIPNNIPTLIIQIKIQNGTRLFFTSIFVSARYVATSPIVSSVAPIVLELSVFLAIGPSIKSVKPQKMYTAKNFLEILLQLNRTTEPIILLQLIIFAKCFSLLSPYSNVFIVPLESLHKFFSFARQESDYPKTPHNNWRVQVRFLFRSF